MTLARYIDCDNSDDTPESLLKQAVVRFNGDLYLVVNNGRSQDDMAATCDYFAPWEALLKACVLVDAPCLALAIDTHLTDGMPLDCDTMIGGEAIIQSVVTSDYRVRVAI